MPPGHRPLRDSHVVFDVETAVATLRGRRVLLVEDNELNRFVATDLLRDVAGMDLALACSGPEALAMLRDAPRFDLVLMDIQMPGMDGLQAARLIRVDPAHAGLPLIAMTAHTAPGDRERIAAAGLDDHVGKPVEPAQLFETMLRWLVPADLACEAAAPAAEPEPGGPAVDFELGLRRCLGRPALYRRVVERYLARRAEVGGEIRGALASGALEEAARAAHTLVSTASTLGAPGLAALARELHDAIAHGLPERWPALLARLDELQSAVDAAVERHARAVAPGERAAG
jgi:two-component system sensor histidine kinase/response regulator